MAKSDMNTVLLLGGAGLALYFIMKNKAATATAPANNLGSYVNQLYGAGQGIYNAGYSAYNSLSNFL